LTLGGCMCWSRSYTDISVCRSNSGLAHPEHRQEKVWIPWRPRYDMKIMFCV